jgi:carbonic anhydrase/acetyltransferase-like protein (isoleucine patch superfamily)
MILEHRGARPTIDPSAYVAPTAVVCGDVHVAGARVLFGAVLTAEDGTPPEELMRRQSEFFGAHREDRECN